VLTVLAAAIIDVEAQLKDIVQNLYNLIVQAYDHHGSKTQEAMKREMYAMAKECGLYDEANDTTASRSFKTW
jgi:uncharacterized membrane protein YgaE (UPF0421/DUF939 family)